MIVTHLSTPAFNFSQKVGQRIIEFQRCLFYRTSALSTLLSDCASSIDLSVCNYLKTVDTIIYRSLTKRFTLRVQRRRRIKKKTASPAFEVKTRLAITIDN